MKCKMNCKGTLLGVDTSHGTALVYSDGKIVVRAIESIGIRLSRKCEEI